MIKNEFACRLKLVRETLGLSQKVMARSVAVSITAWQNYESGDQFPGGKVLEALTQMGFDANWLLTGQGNMQLSEYTSLGSGGVEQVTTIGDRIKIIRGKMSREKFAVYSEISKNTLVNYETGSSSPPAEYLIRILYNNKEINPAWLLTGKGQMQTLHIATSSAHQKPETCGVCMYWGTEFLYDKIRESNEGTYGECMRFPPTIHGYIKPNFIDVPELSNHTLYPVTLSRCWCGEWKLQSGKKR